MRRRLTELPRELADAREELRRLLDPRLEGWRAARQALIGELERIEARSQVGVTKRTFVLVGWTPRAKLVALRRRLEGGLDTPLVVEEVATSDRDGMPVLLSNSRPGASV